MRTLGLTLAVLLLGVLLLGTQPVAAGSLGAPGIAVPLNGLGQTCSDQRYPALAGPFVVACGPSGLVDRVVSLRTGQEWSLPVAMTAPGLAWRERSETDSAASVEGVLVSVGRQAATVVLDPAGPHVLDVPRIRSASIAPPATDGHSAAMLSEGRVSAWPLDSASRALVEAHPLGWYAPALVPGLLAWVEDAGPDGEDIWSLDTTAQRAHPEVLAGGPGDQRHVVASAPFLAWVEPQAVVLLNTDTGLRRRFSAATGFSAPPSLWRDVVCWESRPGGPNRPASTSEDGVDIQCSDGMSAGGRGHQQWPSRYGPWLIYRQDGELWLQTAAEDATEETSHGPG